MRLSAFVLAICLGATLSVSTRSPAKPIHTPRHVSYVESLGQVPLVNKANVGGQRIDMAQFGNWDNVEGECPFKFMLCCDWEGCRRLNLLLRTLFLLHYYDTGCFVVSELYMLGFDVDLDAERLIQFSMDGEVIHMTEREKLYWKAKGYTFFDV
jgi:hypothetical protein